MPIPEALNHNHDSLHSSPDEPLWGAIEAMRTLSRVLAVYRLASDKNMPLHTFEIFLWVAGHPNCLQEELARVTGYSDASITRSLQWLGSTHRSGRRGLGLVRKYADHIDAKRNRVQLTPKAIRLTDLMSQALND